MHQEMYLSDTGRGSRDTSAPLELNRMGLFRFRECNALYSFFFLTDRVKGKINIQEGSVFSRPLNMFKYIHNLHVSEGQSINVVTRTYHHWRKHPDRMDGLTDGQMDRQTNRQILHFLSLQKCNKHIMLAVSHYKICYIKL